ncbi:hypothetical protein COEREDRAFT_84045 [Coemansia reversa NRRL 1564]|uniref:Uncharacterized protein n=1 Tax=Coemansia reversa (strain ATCC 12441 / NRRL 1564) TaxID=763665 RepID=A0A2G5B0K8_COERN|nr:hypothetical protein COEREDRAFT_84045 [Coemansia reversa NRRL 1564]|eukprot:PIA12553.1 hypothetical protein COEREDRAFT_84045 [Coemansia reversa NRRL 1564]
MSNKTKKIEETLLTLEDETKSSAGDKSYRKVKHDGRNISIALNNKYIENLEIYVSNKTDLIKVYSKDFVLKINEIIDMLNKKFDFSINHFEDSFSARFNKYTDISFIDANNNSKKILIDNLRERHFTAFIELLVNNVGYDTINNIHYLNLDVKLLAATKITSKTGYDVKTATAAN